MHEVVNGATGSVTWCGGIDCPRCQEIREAQHRAVAAQQHCPGCRCQPVVRLGSDTLPPWGYRVVGIGIGI